MDAAALRIQSARHDAAAGTLTIEWGDGLRAVYPLVFLRAQCPCATCRDMKEKASQQAADPFRVLPSNLLQPNSEMSGVEPVGRYGMRIVWGDRHDTGIYTFEYLRELAEHPKVRGASGD